MKRELALWLSKAATGFAVLFGIATVVALIASSLYWARYINHFDLTRIQLAPQAYLEEEQILELLELPPPSSLMGIDLAALQQELESYPYIKAARISRDFPSTLCVDVIERSPIAYINHSPFLIVDDAGVVLPLRNGEFEFDIPTLSGFNPASELYPTGEKCLSRKVLEAVDFLTMIRKEFPDLYRDISEVTVNTTDEYVICLAEYPTKVLLGSTPSAWKIQLLNRFSNTIAGVRTLHDYRYVDLRYKKQIIVKEKV